MTRTELKAELSAQHLFWSYAPCAAEDIPDALAIEQALRYGDVPELKALFALYAPEELRAVWMRTLLPDMRQRKLNVYLAGFFFGITNPSEWVDQHAAHQSRGRQFGLSVAPDQSGI